jgi:hypothetical protein
MGHGSVLGRVSLKTSLPDVPATGVETLALEAVEFPEKNIYDAPAKIK